MQTDVTRRALLTLALMLAAAPRGSKAGERRPARAGIDTRPIPLPMDAVAAEVNGFGAKLFAARLAEQARGNTIVSPLSLAAALHMVASGARGKTERAFREALGLGTGPTAQAGKALGDFTQGLLREDPKLILRSTSGIWLAHGIEPQPAYVEAQRAAFRARIESRDFSRPETLDEINGWFSEQTQRMIPKMLAELPANSAMVIANALYFKAQWQEPFDAKQTSPGPFRVAGKEAVGVALMHRRGAMLAYRESEAYQAVRLPFAGGMFEMVVALPRTGLNGLDWAKGLGRKGWSELLDKAGYEKRAGELGLPRVKLASAGEMRPALERIGLREMFAPDADFTGLAKTRVHPDRVIHRTVLQWDEEGAEAAAATAVVGVRAMSPRTGPEPFRMVVDRPFVLALCHVESGTTVLLGFVNDPREEVS